MPRKPLKSTESNIRTIGCARCNATFQGVTSKVNAAIRLHLQTHRATETVNDVLPAVLSRSHGRRHPEEIVRTHLYATTVALK